MEESAQRKERLKAMRMEASQAGPTYNEGGEHSAVSLSNPLLEPTANPSGQVQPSAQSFNYYTNPMAAYTGNKQMTKVSPQISQSSIPPSPQTNDMYPSPSFQPHLTPSPIPRMQTPHGQYQNPNYPYIPNTPQVQGGYPSPGGYRGPHFPRGPAHGPGQGNYAGPGPGYPHPGPSPGRGYGYRGPGPHFRPGPNYGPGSGPGYPTPTSGPNQGRGQWFGNSRGRGRWSGQGQGQGQGGGRGAHNNHVTAEERPDLFYNKSMLEDPWKFLEPVVWKSHNKPKPWTLYSSNTKKPRVSEQKPTSSQPSLAEILAASFNEPDASL